MLSNATVFNINNSKKNTQKTTNQHIRMISEGSSHTKEEWGWKFSFDMTGINSIL